MDSTHHIVILYHAHCPDGFGAAYAAWKKFGDTADYIPLSRSDDVPFLIVENKEVYFLDFSYEKEVMTQLAAKAKKFVVLDHHKGVQEAVESMPEFVFDDTRSGAGIAWDYFHPDMPRPLFINHIEDGDLFRFALPETKAVMTFFEIQPMEFTVWDDLAKTMNADKEKFLEKANLFYEFFARLAELSVERAKLVSFEGHSVYFAYTHSLLSMKSLVGNLLAKKQGPCALVVSAHPEGYGVSIRGDGTIDVAAIARKFGGNGHPNAAGFLIPREGPFPWQLIEDGYDE